MVVESYNYRRSAKLIIVVDGLLSTTSLSAPERGSTSILAAGIAGTRPVSQNPISRGFNSRLPFLGAFAMCCCLPFRSLEKFHHWCFFHAVSMHELKTSPNQLPMVLPLFCWPMLLFLFKFSGRFSVLLLLRAPKYQLSPPLQSIECLLRRPPLLLLFAINANSSGRNAHAHGEYGVNRSVQRSAQAPHKSQ